MEFFKKCDTLIQIESLKSAIFSCLKKHKMVYYLKPTLEDVQIVSKKLNMATAIKFCDICHEIIHYYGTNTGSPFFSCFECNYDVCLECVSKFNRKTSDELVQMANLKNMNCLSKHKMILLEKPTMEIVQNIAKNFDLKTSYIFCDICQKHIYEFKNDVGTPFFNCEKCDYDVCLECFDNYT